MSHFIKIPNLFLTCDFPKDTLLIYSLIVSDFVHSSSESYIFSRQILSYRLGRSESYKSQDIKNSLDWLKEKGIVEKLTNNIYTVTKAVLKITPFTIVYDYELDIIMNSNKRNKEALLLHFVRLVNTFDLKNFNGTVGHQSAEFFHNQYKLCERSFYDYNSTLKELGLIVSEQQGCNSYTGQWYPNLYGRKKDEHEIKRLAKISRKNAATANAEELFG